MATFTDNSHASSHSHFYTTTTSSDDIEDDDEEEGEQDIIHDSCSDHEQHNNLPDNNNEVATTSGRRRRNRGWWLGRVLDPREKWVREWNRVFLLVCGAGLFVDPLFFYAVSLSDTCMCLFVDGWFALAVTVLRCMTDALHVWNMFLQLRMAKRSFGLGAPTDAGGAAAGVKDMSPRSVAIGYLKGKRDFFLDLFVIVPVPQGKQEFGQMDRHKYYFLEESIGLRVSAVMVEDGGDSGLTQDFGIMEDGDGGRVARSDGDCNGAAAATSGGGLLRFSFML